MTDHRHSLEEIQADHQDAATMTASCPLCERSGRRVHAHHKQATRREPCRFLGFQGWCVDCQLAFGLDAVQLALS